MYSNCNFITSVPRFTPFLSEMTLWSPLGLSEEFQSNCEDTAEKHRRAQGFVGSRPKLYGRFGPTSVPLGLVWTALAVKTLGSCTNIAEYLMFSVRSLCLDHVFWLRWLGLKSTRSFHLGRGGGWRSAWCCHARRSRRRTEKINQADKLSPACANVFSLAANLECY